MFKRISKNFIINLLSHVDLIKLINTKVTLKKRGKYFNAYCPFHNEKNPSFFVNYEKQFYYCFGCGAHGNAIDFIMNYERMNFLEAVEELATIQNLEINYELDDELSQTELEHRKILYKLMNDLNLFYRESLKLPEAIHARQYLEKRGLNNDIITHFSIGYAPKINNSLKYNFNYNQTVQFLIKAGIILVDKNGNNYNFFRDRIMFPIRDSRGRIIGFGGRALNNIKPKYLNSTETLIFHKCRQLYGIYENKSNISKYNSLILVEGYMDVLKLYQYGINNAIASLGTSITDDHIKLIFRMTNNIFCCYDNDDAGQKAAWRLLELSIPYMTDERNLSFIILPKEEDPDLFINKRGKEAFKKIINKAIPFTDFLFKNLLNNLNLVNSNNTTQIASIILPIINKIPGELLRIKLKQMLSIKLGIFDDEKLNKFLYPENRNVTFYQNNELKYKNIRTLIELIIKYPEFVSLVPSVNKLNSIKHVIGIDFFIKLLNTCISKPNLTTGQLLEMYRDTKESFTIEKLSIWDDISDKDVAKKTFIDSLNHLLNTELEYKLSKLIFRSRIYGLTSSERKEVKIITEAFARK